MPSFTFLLCLFVFVVLLTNTNETFHKLASEYYKQAAVMLHPQMQLLAIKLTELTLWTARSAPGALCKVGSWLLSGAEAVAQWLMGDGAKAPVMHKQWRVIYGEVAAQCFNAGV